jgi:hypothetical protein
LVNDKNFVLESNFLIAVFSTGLICCCFHSVLKVFNF